jgi:hypothetical protein
LPNKYKTFFFFFFFSSFFFAVLDYELKAFACSAIAN